MPPNPSLTVPTNNNTPTPLIPDPDMYIGSNTDDMFAGLPVVSANKLAKDAFNALFYAYPGVGKTTIEGMFDDYEPARTVLVIDAEGGASVLAHRDRVKVMQVQKWADVEKILTALERTPITQLPYKTVCFDNVTELQIIHLQSIIGNAQPGIQDWGRNTAEMLRFARRVRNLSRYKNINTVLIGWQDNTVDPATKVTRQTVALTDKLSKRLPGVPNIVGHITVLNNPPLYTRRLSFSASPLNDAKFRRATGDAATPIPDEIYYSLQQNPIADILRTLYEGVPFPTAAYQRPKGRQQPQTEAEAKEEAT